MLYIESFWKINAEIDICIVSECNEINLEKLEQVELEKIEDSVKYTGNIKTKVNSSVPVQAIDEDMGYKEEFR